MRRLIVQEFVSVDGFAAGPDGDIGFIPEATEGDDGVAENQMRFIDTVDTIVLGRVTYEMFAGYWPTATISRSRTSSTPWRSSSSRGRSTVRRGARSTTP
jgi:dihydrofolate reductase